MPGSFEMMSRAPVDIVDTGDYQAVERRLGLSWRMLELCPDWRFLSRYGASCLCAGGGITKRAVKA
jgi:hypothetical protein